MICQENTLVVIKFNLREQNAVRKGLVVNCNMNLFVPLSGHFRRQDFAPKMYLQKLGVVFRVSLVLRIISDTRDVFRK